MLLICTHFCDFSALMRRCKRGAKSLRKRLQSLYLQGSRNSVGGVPQQTNSTLVMSQNLINTELLHLHVLAYLCIFWHILSAKRCKMRCKSTGLAPRVFPIDQALFHFTRLMHSPCTVKNLLLLQYRHLSDYSLRSLIYDSFLPVHHQNQDAYTY